MSSMSPLRYLVVTFLIRCISLERGGELVGNTYRLILLIKVINISIENLNKQLDRRGRLHARVSNAQGTLQTF